MFPLSLLISLLARTFSLSLGKPVRSICLVTCKCCSSTSVAAFSITGTSSACQRMPHHGDALLT